MNQTLNKSFEVGIFGPTEFSSSVFSIDISDYLFNRFSAPGAWGHGLRESPLKHGEATSEKNRWKLKNTLYWKKKFLISQNLNSSEKSHSNQLIGKSNYELCSKGLETYWRTIKSFVNNIKTLISVWIIKPVVLTSASRNQE